MSLPRKISPSGEWPLLSNLRMDLLIQSLTSDPVAIIIITDGCCVNNLELDNAVFKEFQLASLQSYKGLIFQ